MGPVRWLVLLCGVGEAALVAHYDFEGGLGLDSTANAYDGTVYGATAATGGDLSGALIFDGLNDEFVLPAEVTANIQGNASRTICAWAAIDYVNSDNAAIWNYGSYEDGEECSLVIMWEGMMLRMQFGTGFNSSITIPGMDDWRHHCLVYDEPSALASFYYDGALAGNNTASVDTGDSQVLHMGYRGVNYARMVLDEVAVYDDARDAAGIAAIFNGYDLYEPCDNSSGIIFRSAANMSSGNVPLWLHAVDVNGDGAMDVAVTFAGDNDVAWLENDGAQSFATRVIDGQAGYPAGVFGIDVDGDGDVDVVAASYNGDEVSWHENDGAESFAHHILSDAADGAAAVHAADVDGDQDVDVLAANIGPNGGNSTFAWWQNHGAGEFDRHELAVAAPCGIPTDSRYGFT